MTKIEVFESRHLSKGGFFRYLFRALKEDGASVVEKAPFPPEGRTQRHHEGAWARIGAALVFFDMSDHVFDFDRQALRHADFYLKANLNRPLARRVLVEDGLEVFEEKLRPFTFLPPSLPKCRRIAALSLRKWMPGPQLFHVVGVYENPIVGGETDPFRSPGEKVEPRIMHFWIRWHFAQAIRKIDLSSISRLTSRGNSVIEDRVHVQPNLNHHLYLLRMASSGCTVLNTLPHAVYPWKALESIALGRPFLVEREPLVEIPEAFRPVPGVHCLEVLPGLGSFDDEAPLSDPRSYRVLEVPSVEAILEGFERLASILRDPLQMDEMEEACRKFARERLAPAFIVQWLKDVVGHSS